MNSDNSFHCRDTKSYTLFNEFAWTAHIIYNSLEIAYNKTNERTRTKRMRIIIRPTKQSPVSGLRARRLRPALRQF